MNTDKFEPPRTIKCQNTFYIYLISHYLQSTDEVGVNFISFESKLRILEILNELYTYPIEVLIFKIGSFLNPCLDPLNCQLRTIYFFQVR